MKKMRKVYDMMLEASVAHAKWDYEVSSNILKRKSRLLILFILLLPIILVSLAQATGNLPVSLGGKETYTPEFYTTSVFLLSIVIGFCAGLITGCIGAGGGFIITPALMSIGIKGILAVGTDLFHIFAKAIMGTVIHKKLGNVCVGLAVAFLVGSGIGVVGGGVINRTLYEINPILSDTFISLFYVFLLGFLGVYALTDFLRLRKKGEDVDVHRSGSSLKEKDGSLKKATLSSRLQASNIPPVINFDQDLVPGGKKIPALFVAICGSIVGFVAAIMGVGGGFLTFPMFVYILGVSSYTTVGTDITQIIFTAGFASITQYAIYGFIFYTLAMGMLIGSLAGIQIGALTTKVVRGIYIRGFYAMAILAGFFNRLFILPKKLDELGVIAIPKTILAVLTQFGTISFYITIAIFALWVTSKFFLNIKQLRA
ncbi:MAG: sulfite exporter TauE/SafE family protein [Deltaproteobacteria bacterium]|nr:sulfite exporter TauE/SafE family protein [Deltaproteobacteria bacterium]